MAQPPIDSQLAYASELAYRILYDGSNFDFTLKDTQDLLDKTDLSKDSIKIAVGGPRNINACFYGRTKGTGEGILAFRGTLPPDPLPVDLQSWLRLVDDWLGDGEAAQIAFDPIPGLVHEGLCLDLKTLFETILTWKVSQTPFYVTGHSKGGSLSHLASLWLSKLLQGPKEIVTFAAARVGNAVFADAFEATFVGRARRYEFGNDIVPHLPPDREYLGSEAGRSQSADLARGAFAAMIGRRIYWPDYKSVGTLLYRPERIAIIEGDSLVLHWSRIAAMAVGVVADEGKSLVNDHALSGYIDMATS